MRTFRKLITATAGAAVLAGSSLLASPALLANPATAPPPSAEPKANFDPKAASDPHEFIGHRTSPGQGYHQNPNPEYDWIGSYRVNGKQVWCVQFALTAPNTDEQYRPGDALKTKWGDPLKPRIAANISYLLLRYGETRKPNEAAALAHLLHSWTAAPRTPEDLNPNNGFETIGYDVRGHFDKLPPKARKLVGKLRAEANTNRGPWKASLTAPQGQQTIGQESEWTLRVQRAKSGDGVGDVPVKLTMRDVTVQGVGEDGTVRTPRDGGPLRLKVTPTGPNPKIEGQLSAPADRPFVQDAVNAPRTTQRVVSTGGEKQLAVRAATEAVTAPGAVHVRKVDAQSEDGIAGVALRVTSGDKKSPATRQNGAPLVGPDGSPVVVTTRQDGSLAVPALRTPQQLCVVETAPAPGYEQAFDPANPPSACGKLKPGGTLALNLANKANTPSVPITIPAGDGTTSMPAENGSTGGSIPYAGLAAFALAGLGVGAGIAWLRRTVTR